MNRFKFAGLVLTISATLAVTSKAAPRSKANSSGTGSNRPNAAIQTTFDVGGSYLTLKSVGKPANSCKLVELHVYA
jgi:hypothetical protein